MQRRLGGGGFGDVHLVEDMVGRSVPSALKVLRPELTDDGSDRERIRFDREARTLRNLVHSSIVPIRHFFRREGICGFVMDDVDGPTLGALVEDEGPLEPARALARTRETFAALAYAHDRASRFAGWPRLVGLLPVSPCSAFAELPGHGRFWSR